MLRRAGRAATQVRRQIDSVERTVCRGVEPIGNYSLRMSFSDGYDRKTINRTRVPLEKEESIRWLDNVRQLAELLGGPGRCVHVGDRESDIYELFLRGSRSWNAFRD
ncbi:DUF971 family protein [Bradyrhizobium sp. USDA 4341]